ncbi:hypothetical protein Y032_0019g3813 [Ancylostoma ceylanicum]|uniref:Uncharacterized protein n=1 Tax=Ancylostoma ceylanicum TaxID=53326 RepID=A0A016V179_9BILA|nr:hypothetical protein Y032_0019g3813 [Ancylostoma ceylanicum]
MKRCYEELDDGWQTASNSSYSPQSEVAPVPAMDALLSFALVSSQMDVLCRMEVRNLPLNNTRLRYSRYHSCHDPQGVPKDHTGFIKRNSGMTAKDIDSGARGAVAWRACQGGE